MGNWAFILAALAGGLVLPVQVAINTVLRKELVVQPMRATFVSNAVGALASLAICLVARYPLPSSAALAGSAWWMWCAGGLGVIYVWSTIIATPQIGAALALALTIAGQMIAAVCLDHAGAFGLQRFAISPLRIAGVILVVGGVGLIAASRK